MIARVLRYCGHLSCTHYRLVLVLGILLTLLALTPTVFLSSGRFSASVTKLLPAGNRAAEAFERALNDFGAADEVYVLFRLRNAEDLDAVGRYGDELAARLRGHLDFRDATCRW
ncbi:MAG: hypothetical protein ACOCX4_07345, partial [Planctomycetota bacterium]